MMMVCIFQSAVFCAAAEGETNSSAAGSELSQGEEAASEDDESAAAAAAAGTGEDDPYVSEQIVYSKDHHVSKLRKIRYPFLDTKYVAYDWTFPYSDRFFDIPSEEFSIRHARGSLGLALCAFRSTAHTVPDQYMTYLTEAGYKDIFAFGYDKETTEDSLSGVIARKEIKDFTVIAVVTCGQGYQNEWAGNLKVGSGDRHEGFNNGAQLLEKYIDSYIASRGINGKKKLWLTGMSRAGAVANITAADLIERGDFDDIYAYLFGVPRTTKKPVAYKGIYNICGQYDPVSSIPLQSWGYERYGTDLYTPAQESDHDYSYFADAAGDVSWRLEKKDFRNNPEVNYQLRLVMEFLGEFFPTSEDYTERLQPILLEAMSKGGYSSTDILGLLRVAFEQLKPRNAKERAGIRVFIDYVTYVAGQHMRAEQRQVIQGNWDPDEPLEANLVLEHRPSTYVKWLFAKVDPEELFAPSITSRRVTVIGKVNVAVLKGDVELAEIDLAGNVYQTDTYADDYESGAFGIFVMRNGNETTICLPDDDEYRVILDSWQSQSVSYYDVLESPLTLDPVAGTIHIGILKDGTCGFDVKPGEDLPDPEDMSGDYKSINVSEFDYASTVIMSNELNATRYSFLSLSNAYQLVMIYLTGIFALLLICFVIHILHNRGRKKGHGPYSDLYVIIPHIVLILAFAGLTQFLTFYLFSIGEAREKCAALTVFLAALLALRGAAREKKKTGYLTAAVLLLLTILTGMYYNRLPITDFSEPSMAAFFGVIGLFTFAAACTFRDPKDVRLARSKLRQRKEILK